MALQINKALEKEEFKDILELKSVPKAVDDRLAALYSELPDTVPTVSENHRAAKRIDLRKYCVAAASAAAFVVLSFGTLCAFPAFAATLPVIGGIFRSFNTLQTADNVQGSREYIQTNSQTVEGVSAFAAASGKDEKDVTVSLREAYYDGSYVYIGLEAAADVDADEMFADAAETYINGEKQTESGDFTSLTPNDYSWQRTEDGRWINERSFRVPEKYRNLDSLDIKIVFTNGMYIVKELPGDPDRTITVINQEVDEDGNVTESTCEIPAGYYDDDGVFHAESEFVYVPVNSSSIGLTLTVDKTAGDQARVAEGGGLEMGGVRLESVKISPVAVEITAEYPASCKDPATGAYFADGRALGCLDETAPEETANGEKYTRIFSGISADETREIIYPVYDKNGSGEFIAVFIIDPVSGTARLGTEDDVPASFWGDPDKY